MITLPYLQYALTNPGVRDLFFSHYLSLLVGPIFLASMIGIVHLKKKLPYIGRQEKIFGYSLMGIVLVASMLVLGPVNFQVKTFWKSPRDERTKIRNYLARMIEVDDSMLMSEDWLSKLSGRREGLAFHYTFLGKQQFSSQKYELPELDGALLNFERMMLTGSMMENFKKGADNSLKDE